MAPAAGSTSRSSRCTAGRSRVQPTVLWCTAALLLCTTPALAQPPQTATPSLLAAQDLFYNAKYPEAAAMALALREAQPDELAAYELRTSALHFQIKRAIGDAP